jgi:hypothetical protein
MARIGSVQVSPPGAYEEGFMVEQFDYWNTREPAWAVPAWDERGHPELCGPFATAAEAAAAIASV